MTTGMMQKSGSEAGSEAEQASSEAEQASGDDAGRDDQQHQSS